MTIRVELRNAESGRNNENKKVTFPYFDETNADIANDVYQNSGFSNIPQKNSQFNAWTMLVPLLGLFAHDAPFSGYEKHLFSSLKVFRRKFFQAKGETQKLLNGTIALWRLAEFSHKLIDSTINSDHPRSLEASADRVQWGITAIAELYDLSRKSVDVIDAQELESRTKNFYAELIRGKAAAGLLEAAARVMIFLNNVTLNPNYNAAAMQLLEKLLLNLIDIGEIKKAIIFYRANEHLFDADFKNTFRKRAVIKGFPDTNFELPKLAKEAAKGDVPRLKPVTGLPCVVIFPSREVEINETYKRVREAISANPIDALKELRKLRDGLNKIKERSLESVRRK